MHTCKVSCIEHSALPQGIVCSQSSEGSSSLGGKGRLTYFHIYVSANIGTAWYAVICRVYQDVW